MGATGPIKNDIFNRMDTINERDRQNYRRAQADSKERAYAYRCAAKQLKHYHQLIRMHNAVQISLKFNHLFLYRTLSNIKCHPNLIYTIY